MTRIRATGISRDLSPLPLMAAGVGAACMCVGGESMAVISGSELFSSLPEPSADLLRFGNDLGFTMVGVAGMTAIALSVGCLSVQAHRVGLFGRKLLIFGLIDTVVLLASLLFIPIVALLIWLIVVAVALIRRSTVRVQAPLATAPPTVS